MIGIRIPVSKWIRLKKVLLDNDTTLQASMEGYIDRYLERFEKKP